MIRDVKKLGKAVKQPLIGRFYFFGYDAKLKETLPLWDKFPLCLPLEPYSDGFLGLNLHYVPIGTRKIILTELKKYIDLGPPQRIRASYQFLKVASLFNDVSPCIKRYLRSHVKTNFIDIDPANWDMALKLPVANWQKGKPFRNAK